MRRCRLSMQYINTLCHDTLPLVYPANHQIANLGPHRLYVKVPLSDALYVVSALLGDFKKAFLFIWGTILTGVDLCIQFFFISFTYKPFWVSWWLLVLN